MEEAMVQQKVNGAFTIPTRALVMIFDDGDYAGAEVKVRMNVPLGVLWEIQAMAQDNPRPAFDLFGDRVLLEWNLRSDGGEAIPVTSDGMNELPVDLAILIMEKWAEVVFKAPAPLPNSSPNGVTSAEEDVRTAQ